MINTKHIGGYKMKFKLENWSVATLGTPYTAPELILSALIGNIYGHHTFKDGLNITTSAIIGKRNDFIVTRSGSLYELGEVSKEYESLYPNAKSRLLDSLINLEEVVE
jgi:hypothetical protein